MYAEVPIFSLAPLILQEFVADCRFEVSQNRYQGPIFKRPWKGVEHEICDRTGLRHQAVKEFIVAWCHVNYFVLQLVDREIQSEPYQNYFA